MCKALASPQAAANTKHECRMTKEAGGFWDIPSGFVIRISSFVRDYHLFSA
jgi:hypothetical protein